MLLFSVVHNCFQIDFGHYLEQICLILHGPTSVHDDILQAILARKINICLVSLGVYARFEAHIVESPIVPPVPSYLSWLDPSSVFDARRRSQQIDQIIIQ